MATPERFPENLETGIIEVPDQSLIISGLKKSRLHVVPNLEEDSNEPRPFDFGEEVVDNGSVDILAPLDEVEGPTAVDLEDEELAEIVAASHDYKIDVVEHMYRNAYDAGELLTAAQEVELAKKIEAGDSAAKTQMVISNLRLVFLVAYRFEGMDLALEDLVQEGNLGLMKAADKFDWRKGTKFSTYATWWIRQACQRAIANKGKTIRIPVPIRDRRRKLNEAADRLQKKLGREATRSELAVETGSRLDQVHEALDVPIANISLNYPLGEDSETDFGSIFSDDTVEDTDEESWKNIRGRLLLEALLTLDETQRKIILMRFGFGSEQKSHVEISESEGIPKAQVGKIEKAALEELAKYQQLQLVRDGDIPLVLISSGGGGAARHRYNMRLEDSLAGKEYQLTENEYEIVRATANGMDKYQIAHVMGFEPSQVLKRLESAQRKLKEGSIKDLVDRYRTLKVVKQDI